MWLGSPEVLKSSPMGGKEESSHNNKEVNVITTAQGSHEDAILTKI
jgi:hypothetical protein